MPNWWDEAPVVKPAQSQKPARTPAQTSAAKSGSWWDEAPLAASQRPVGDVEKVVSQRAPKILGDTARFVGDVAAFAKSPSWEGAGKALSSGVNAFSTFSRNGPTEGAALAPALVGQLGGKALFDATGQRARGIADIHPFKGADGKFYYVSEADPTPKPLQFDKNGKMVLPSNRKPVSSAREDAGVLGENALNALTMPLGTGGKAVPQLKPGTQQFLSNAERLKAAGVTPFAAITSPGKAKTIGTNMIGENMIAGAPTRSRLQRALNEVETGANALAAQYGAVRGRQLTGEGIQAGIERFATGSGPDLPRSAPARASSFSTKTTNVYNDAFAPILAAEEGKLAQQQSLMRVGASARVKPVVNPSETAATLKDVNERINSPALSTVLTEGPFRRIAQALETDAPNVRFTDLRNLRTWVREAQTNDKLRQSIGSGNLQRLEGALTQDIYANAEALAGPNAAMRLRRADALYAAGVERINGALSTFTRAKSGEGAYAKVLEAAGSTSRGDVARLIALKRTLNTREWGDVSANILTEMGQAKAGAQTAGDGPLFSISEFVTNYNKLSPKGRDILFGSAAGGGKKGSDLRRSLDDLAWAASQVKQVEAGANMSRSGVNLQNAGSLFALANPVSFKAAAAGLGGMALTGEMLTNPAVVRVLTKAIRTRASRQQVIASLEKLTGRISTAGAAQKQAQDAQKSQKGGGAFQGGALSYFSRGGQQ